MCIPGKQGLRDQTSVKDIDFTRLLSEAHSFWMKNVEYMATRLNKQL